MKKFIILILFINILSKNSKYYSSCEQGAPNSGFITYSECKKYAKNGNYCCLLYYVSNPDVELNFYFYSKTKDDDVKSEDESEDEELNKGKKRVLDERTNLCYGLSTNGYNHIDNVIDELEKESGIEGIHIDCLAGKIKFNSIIIVLTLFIFL